jgi:hypothetical protein
MHFNIGLYSGHQIANAVGAHTGSERIVGVVKFKRWPEELRREVGRMQLQHDTFQVFRRRETVLPVTQVRLGFYHYVLDPFFVCMYGLLAQLRVGTEHSAAHNLQRQ